MKRLAVFSLMVLASLILAACIGTAQATLNSSTPTSAIPNTGGVELGTATEASIPSTGGTSESGLATSPSTDLTSTVFPSTGGTAVVETPTGLGDQQSALETSQALYSTPVVQDTATSQVPVTGGTQEPLVSSTPQPQTSVPVTGGTAVPAESFLRLQALKNYSLMNSSGSTLGQVTDFVIDAAGGKVVYLVVSVQNRTVLVPWTAISNVDQTFNAFMFQFTSDSLQNAPVFDASIVDFNQSNWDQDVMNYWNSVNSGNGTATPGAASSFSGTSVPSTSATSTGGNITSSSVVYRFSDLVNVQVVTPDILSNLGSLITGTSVPNTGTTMVLGSVQDAIVNPSTGELPLLLVMVNTNVSGLQNRLIPVPYAGFQRGVNGNTLFLSITADMLRNVPNFDLNSIPNSLGPDWNNGIMNFWNSFMSQLQVTPSTQPTP